MDGVFQESLIEGVFLCERVLNENGKKNFLFQILYFGPEKKII